MFFSWEIFFIFSSLSLKVGQAENTRHFLESVLFVFFELGKFKGLHFQKYKIFFKAEAGKLCFLKYKRNFFSENIRKFLL